MERIALISDIHSNIVALKAVLEDVENADRDMANRSRDISVDARET